jgi:hypothetical protein
MRLMNAACEGVLDGAVLRRLAQECGVTLDVLYNARGKDQLDGQLAKFAAAARARAFVALRDLDRDAECAPELVRRLSPPPAPGFRLQVAVRQIEAWLLADASGIGRELGVHPRLVPARPEEVSDAKQALLALARRSRKGRTHADYLPRSVGARVGPRYTSRLVRFVMQGWQPAEARRRSPSLGAMMDFLQSTR